MKKYFTDSKKYIFKKFRDFYFYRKFIKSLNFLK